MQIKLCYINQHWNVYLYTTDGYESWTDKMTLISLRDETIFHEGEYRLRVYECPEIPIHSFGWFADNPRQRPGHGGEWSSNSTTINKVFGVELWEVGIDQMAMAVPITWMKQQLGDKVKWQDDDIYGHIITEIKGEENVYSKWVTL